MNDEDRCYLTDHEGNILASMSKKCCVSILKQMMPKDYFEDSEKHYEKETYVKLKQKYRLTRKGELILRIYEQIEDENPQPLTKDEYKEIIEIILDLSKKVSEAIK